jgi:hypothetical protein
MGMSDSELWQCWALAAWSVAGLLVYGECFEGDIWEQDWRKVIPIAVLCGPACWLLGCFSLACMILVKSGEAIHYYALRHVLEWTKQTKPKDCE